MKKKLLLKSMLLLCALIAGSSNVWAGSITDVIDYSATSSYLSNTGTTNWATNFSITGTSGAQYTIHSMGTKNTSNALQWNSNGFLYATSSGGKLKSVTITTTANKSINLYASTTAYTAAPSGTALATISATSSGTTYTFATNSNYTYIALKGTASSTSITSIEIEWERTDPTITFDDGEVPVGQTLDLRTLFESNSPGAVTYSIKTGASYASLGSDGYTLTGLSEGDVTVQAVQAATSTYASMTVTATVTVSAAKVLNSIAITNSPIKTTYDVGDYFDPTGIVVTATYDDASTRDVTALCTYSPTLTTALTIADDKVVVSYTENETTKTADQVITVNAVAVTGISLNNSSIEIAKNGTFTLLPIFEPTNATNQNVTWESDNTSVATVSAAGVVTGVAVGEATITVKTDDGDFTATCEVTVINPKGSADNPYTVAEVIALNPQYTSSAAATDVYVTGYIIGCCDSNGEIYTDPSNYVNSNLVLADDPDETINYITVQLANNTTHRTNYNVKDHPEHIGVTKLLIKADVFKYCSKPGLKNIDEMTTVALAIKTSKAMTTFCSKNALNFDGSKLKAYAVASVGTAAVLEEVTDIPASTGLILVGTAGTTYEISVGTATTLGTTNKLVGVTEDTEISMNTPTEYDYVLSNGKFVRSANGTLPAGKAYLPATAIPVVAGVPSLELVFDGENGDGDATGINTIDNERLAIDNSNVYNLNGQRVAQPTKGLYIVNGKKVVIK